MTIIVIIITITMIITITILTVTNLFELTPKSKKKSISFLALIMESLPCVAFLVPSRPNFARRESGRVDAASETFAGLFI